MPSISGDLSSIPRPHIKVERTDSTKAVLCLKKERNEKEEDDVIVVDDVPSNDLSQ